MLPVLLFILFLTLKLVGVIAWSWVWVTSPLWIAAVIWMTLLVLIGFKILGVFLEAVTAWKR